MADKKKSDGKLGFGREMSRNAEMTRLNVTYVAVGLAIGVLALMAFRSR